ncbi:MAG: shikimate kinase [Kiritimatiellae bacterium]|nr:shikimate kinase [Kiritimatiellia bacterium]
MESPNIILFGFMGTGKSTVGALVARQTARVHLDTDTLIEKQVGSSIADIFSAEGELFFRDVERKVIQNVSQKKNLVITVGGGAVLYPENINRLETNGVLICLRASVEIIFKRIGTGSSRPLLEGVNTCKAIEKILEKRMPLYDALPHQVDTSELSPASVAEQVIQIYSCVC